MTTYFISYFAKTRWGNTKWGCMVVETNCKIVDGETFADMTDFIRKENNFKKVAIMNIQELGEDK